MMDLGQLEQQNGLPPGLLSAVMQQESGGNPNAVSPRGALGAFQFMPQTAQQYGIDPRNIDQSAQAAAQMLGQLSQKYNGSIPHMLAGYNWGQGNVDRQGLNNAPPETQGYIQNITSRLMDPAISGKINPNPPVGTPTPLPWAPPGVARPQQDASNGGIMNAIGNFIIPSANAAEMPQSNQDNVFDVQMPDGTTIRGVPMGTTQSQLQIRLAKMPPSTQQQSVQIPNSQTNYASDVVGGFGRGLSQGAVGLVTVPIDLGATAGGWLAKKAVGNNDLNGFGYETLGKIFGPGGLPQSPPNLTNLANNQLGINGQAKTIPGQFAQTIGNFVPAVAAATMGNEAPLSTNLSNIMKQAAFMGGGSEAAGQLTKGSSIEPYARIAGGVAGNFAPASISALTNNASEGASNLWNGITARSPDEMQSESTALLKGAGGEIQGAKNANVIFSPEKTQEIATSVDKAISTNSFIPEMNPKTSGIVAKIQSIAERDGNLQLSDLQQYRTLLNRIAPTEDGVSAGAVKRALDDAINSATQSDLISGSPDAIKALNIGRSNYAAASRFEDVADLLSKANGDPNRIKQGLSRFAADPDNYRGWNMQQVAALKSAADTGVAENLMKALGKFGFSFSKPGVGNTALPALAAGLGAAGVPGGIPLAIAGTAARAGQTYLARGKADKLLDLLSKMKANGAMQ